MKTATMIDGQTSRKTLSGQIDRLDLILYGLADGLQEAVAGAVQGVMAEVVRLAVQEAVTETLKCIPLAQAAAPPASDCQQKPSLLQKCQAGWSRLKGNIVEKTVQLAWGACRYWAWGLERLRKLLSGPYDWLGRLVLVCRQGGGRMGEMAQAGWRHRQVVGISLSVGALLGLSSYLCGPLVAFLVSGVCGSMLAAGGMIGWALWQLLRGAEQA